MSDAERFVDDPPSINLGDYAVLRLLRYIEGLEPHCLVCGGFIADGHDPRCRLAWTIGKLDAVCLDRPGDPNHPRTFQPRPAPPADLTNTPSEGPTNKNGAGDSLAGARSEAAG